MKNSFLQLKKPSFNSTFQLDKKKILFKKLIIKKKNNNNNNISNCDSKNNALLNKFSLRKNYSQRIKMQKQKSMNDINNSMSNNDSNIKTNELDNKLFYKSSSSINKNARSINKFNNNSVIKYNVNNSNIISMSNTNMKTSEETKTKFDNTMINFIKINSSVNNENLNKSNKIKLPKLNYNKKKNKRKIPFLLKSYSSKITSNDIYLHYLKEDENDKNKVYSLYDFIKYLDTNTKKFNYGLDKIYGSTKSFISRINEIKKNKNIAKKNDFVIEDYQNTMLKLLKNHMDEKYLNVLEKRYKSFDKIHYGMLIPKGRYIDLADKLKDFLSKDIFEKMKNLDKNYKLYIEKKKELQSKNLSELEKKDKFFDEFEEYLENREKNKKKFKI